MNELKNELFAAPTDVWKRVPITANRHKWFLLWCRFGDDGGFCFSFVSPKGRMYSFYTESNSGRHVTSAEIVVASGDANVVSYYESWGDKLDKLDAILRRTPRHIQYKLSMLLDAIDS